MTNRSALALAFATGYVVGRGRTKLPLGTGGALLARRLGVDPGRLGERFKERTPQLAEATGRLRNNVREAGRVATGALPTGRLESLTGGVRGQLGRVPWKSGGEDGSQDSRAPEERKEKSGKEAEDPKGDTRGARGANGSQDTGGSRKEAADSGKSQGGRSTSRRAPAKKTASRTAKKTAATSRKPAKAAGKAAGSAGKQTETGRPSGGARKTTGTAKRTGGSGRG